MSSFAETLKTLPSVAEFSRLDLYAGEACIASIENKPGQAGSLAVYAYLLQQFGCINGDAAARGLALYGEHTADARSFPGKHPNIDRLIAIEQGGAALEGKLLPAA
ncbi:MAG: hypothetical protein QG667_1709 [Pseudomonadota bacterium]|jgi:hypothetical protein|nr:hypothetical protein [Pseudomonadota bacterium]